MHYSLAKWGFIVSFLFLPYLWHIYRTYVQLYISLIILRLMAIHFIQVSLWLDQLLLYLHAIERANSVRLQIKLTDNTYVEYLRFHRTNKVGFCQVISLCYVIVGIVCLESQLLLAVSLIYISQYITIYLYLYRFFNKVISNAPLPVVKFKLLAVSVKFAHILIEKEMHNSVSMYICRL